MTLACGIKLQEFTIMDLKYFIATVSILSVICGAALDEAKKSSEPQAPKQFPSLIAERINDAKKLAIKYGGLAAESTRDYIKVAQDKAVTHGPIVWDNAQNYGKQGWDIIRDYSTIGLAVAKDYSVKGWEESKKLSEVVYKGTAAMADRLRKRYYLTQTETASSNSSRSNEL